MKHEIEFYECEHDGDLNNYISDLQESGASVIDSNINHEAEIGHVTIEVEDYEAFLEKFKETDSIDFSSIRH